MNKTFMDFKLKSKKMSRESVVEMEKANKHKEKA